MSKEKKTDLVLLKVSDKNDDEVRAAISAALDALDAGHADQKPPKKPGQKAKKQPARKPASRKKGKGRPVI